VGFSLAIIASYVLNYIYLKTSGKKSIAIFLACCLIFIQFYDQKRVFNSFNSEIDEKSFFPETETISYVMRNSSLLQYAMSDNGYIISGTLGAYNIPQWFAHGFKSNKEKNVLSRLVTSPFCSPTAASYECSDINLKSRYINLLNVKYILCSNNLTKRHFLWTINGPQKPCPPLPENTLKQSFTIAKEKVINGISLLMATYGRKHASSDILLRLKKSGNIIAKSIVSKSNVRDNTWVNFKFNNSLTLDPGDYKIKLEFTNSDVNNKRLTVWSNTNCSNNQLLVNGEKRNICFIMALLSKIQIPNKYKIKSLEPNITILQNKDVNGNAYFVDSLNKYNVKRWNIEVKKMSNTSLRINYNADNPGWIVIPMRKYPGWKAYASNGKILTMDSYLGILPAIKVNGQSKILFKYDPFYNVKPFLLSFLGIISIIIIAIYYRGY
jgi:hypothetical protein